VVGVLPFTLALPHADLFSDTALLSVAIGIDHRRPPSR
jgi:hypothetical protein